MTVRVNARVAIRERALKLGWVKLPCADDAIDLFTDGPRVLRIRYEMFGAVINYMCKFYGKDPHSGVNWGVADARVAVCVEHDGDRGLSWANEQAFTGAKKREQILAWLKDNPKE